MKVKEIVVDIRKINYDLNGELSAHTTFSFIYIKYMSLFVGEHLAVILGALGVVVPVLILCLIWCFYKRYRTTQDFCKTYKTTIYTIFD